MYSISQKLGWPIEFDLRMSDDCTAKESNIGSHYTINPDSCFVYFWAILWTMLDYTIFISGKSVCSCSKSFFILLTSSILFSFLKSLPPAWTTSISGAARVDSWEEKSGRKPSHRRPPEPNQKTSATSDTCESQVPPHGLDGPWFRTAHKTGANDPDFWGWKHIDVQQQNKFVLRYITRTS